MFAIEIYENLLIWNWRARQRALLLLQKKIRSKNGLFCFYHKLLFIYLLHSSFSKKKKNPQCYREWEPWSLKELLLFFYFLYFHLVVWKHSLKNKRDKMKIRLLRNQVCQKTPLGYLLWMQLSLYMPSCFEWLIPMFFLWEDSSFSF